MKKRVSIYNNYSPNHQAKRNRISYLLKEHGFLPIANGEIVMVIGGDGTFLSAVKEKWKDNVLFAPVNSGTLGYFSEYNYSDVKDYIKMLANGQYHIEEYPLYEVEVMFSSGKIVKEYFINDVTIKQSGGNAIHLDLIIDDASKIIYDSDGLVISSFLGSTAYNSSLGGAIILDNVPNLQIAPIAPINNSKYKCLRNAIIINDKSTIVVQPSLKKKRQFHVICDNKEIKFNKGIEKITISNKGYNFKVIRTNGFNHVSNLIKKIL